MNETVSLNSRIEGDGSPIILMHGLFGSHRNWFSVQRQLADRWQVHALDLRNHGASGWAEVMSYEIMSRDVIAYMDDRQIDRAVLLGHSMGGKVAMSIALQFPQRVSALICVDIAPVIYEPSLRPFVEGLQAVDLSCIASRRQVDAALVQSVPDSGVRGFLLQNLVREGSSYRWRINLSAISDNLDRLGDKPAGMDSAAGQYSGPVLAIYGALSDYVSDSARAVMTMVFPTSQFVPIPNAGHWVHAEQASAFNAGLFNFLGPLRSV